MAAEEPPEGLRAADPVLRATPQYVEEVADSSQEFARELERQIEMEDETLDVGTTTDEPASSSWVQAPSADQPHHFVGG